MASFYRNNKCQTFFLFSLYRKIITTIVIQPYHLDIVTKTDGLIDSDSLAGGFTLSLFGNMKSILNVISPQKCFKKSYSSQSFINIFHIFTGSHPNFQLSMWWGLIKSSVCSYCSPLCPSSKTFPNHCPPGRI